MKEQLYKYGVIYLGTLSLMVAPFFIQTPYGKVCSILGLILITVQTQKTKSYNLSLLNIVGIVGYLFSLTKQLLG